MTLHEIDGVKFRYRKLEINDIWHHQQSFMRNNKDFKYKTYEFKFEAHEKITVVRDLYCVAYNGLTSKQGLHTDSPLININDYIVIINADHRLISINEYATLLSLNSLHPEDNYYEIDDTNGNSLVLYGAECLGNINLNLQSKTEPAMVLEAVNKLYSTKYERKVIES